MAFLVKVVGPHMAFFVRVVGNYDIRSCAEPCSTIFGKLRLFCRTLSVE